MKTTILRLCVGLLLLGAFACGDSDKNKDKNAKPADPSAKPGQPPSPPPIGEPPPLPGKK